MLRNFPMLFASAAAKSHAHAKSMRKFRSISSLEDSDGGYFTHGLPQKKSRAISKCNIYTQVKGNRALFQSRTRLR